MEGHTAKDYDELLGEAKLMVLQMASRVQRQVRDAVEGLLSGSPALIARRQPGRDVRHASAEEKSVIP